ncbi:MAG: methylmalonyl-CoA mutase small subunit [Paludibacteraceae bacterium]|nr:methylmalonyl-CoA mutase small subunit [Paludibacteraceae bacterium]
MAEKKMNLLADFPAVSTQEWLDKVTADLKGADFNKKLVWKTNEGFDVMPFYRAEDIQGLKTTEVVPGLFPYVRGTKADNKWFVRQDIEVMNVKEANAKALDVLNKGVDSLGFKLNRADVTPEGIATLLEGIAADCVELNFSTCTRTSAQLVTILSDYFKSKAYAPHTIQVSVNWDAMNSMLLRGKDYAKEEIVSLAKAAYEASLAFPFFRVIGVNATTLSNAGAFVAQELGYALAWANEYLSSLVVAGCETSLVAKRIKFNFGVGGNYFMEIAKFRAAKLLWAQIVDAYQGKCLRPDCPETVNGICKCAAKMRIHAQTSEFNKTIFDANVNMLRTQTEAMSATLGGVNSLTVLPYDSTYKKGDEFSERIARNQQLLLKEESHFDKVADPAAGSYYIETLTNNIAAQAWKLFLEIEDNGGFFAAVKAGTVQKAVKETATKRLKSVSSRREVLLGTNQFPNFNETAAAKVEKSASGEQNENATETLVSVRAAEEFEALRFATEAAAKRPKAFMLTIGSLAMRLARAQFSCNFFACAGYEVVDNLGFKTVEEGVAAAQAAGADIIVLCSSDDEYAELAPAAFKAIDGKQLFVVAGAPACTDDLKAIGIEHFINVKTNVLETLKAFNAKLV